MTPVFVTQLLMRPEAKVLTILGTGKQALSHYEVFTELFAFKEVISPFPYLVEVMAVIVTLPPLESPWFCVKVPNAHPPPGPASFTCHISAPVWLFQSLQVRVWSHTRQRAEMFCQSVPGPAKAFSLAEEAVRGADVIVTVTRSTEPVLFGAWVKTGAHVSGKVAPLKRHCSEDSYVGVCD